MTRSRQAGRIPRTTPPGLSSCGGLPGCNANSRAVSGHVMGCQLVIFDMHPEIDRLAPRRFLPADFKEGACRTFLKLSARVRLLPGVVCIERAKASIAIHPKTTLRRRCLSCFSCLWHASVVARLLVFRRGFGPHYELIQSTSLPTQRPTVSPAPSVFHAALPNLAANTRCCHRPCAACNSTKLPLFPALWALVRYEVVPRP